MYLLLYLHYITGSVQYFLNGFLCTLIQIQKASEYGSNKDPDPKHWFYINSFRLSGSVVDPNTLNLDPDTGFWLNLDSDPDPGPVPDPGFYYQF